MTTWATRRVSRTWLRARFDKDPRHFNTPQMLPSITARSTIVVDTAMALYDAA